MSAILFVELTHDLNTVEAAQYTAKSAKKNQYRPQRPICRLAKGNSISGLYIVPRVTLNIKHARHTQKKTMGKILLAFVTA